MKRKAGVAVYLLKGDKKNLQHLAGFPEAVRFGEVGVEKGANARRPEKELSLWTRASLGWVFCRSASGGNKQNAPKGVEVGGITDFSMTAPDARRQSVIVARF